VTNFTNSSKTSKRFKLGETTKINLSIPVSGGRGRAVIKEAEIDGKNYIKKQVSHEIYEKYCALYNLGVGVAILKYEDGFVVMEKGKPLDYALFSEHPKNGPE
jgi:hypothetical protein